MKVWSESLDSSDTLLRRNVEYYTGSAIPPRVEVSVHENTEVSRSKEGFPSLS